MSFLHWPRPKLMEEARVWVTKERIICHLREMIRVGENGEMLIPSHDEMLKMQNLLNELDKKVTLR